MNGAVKKYFIVQQLSDFKISAFSDNFDVSRAKLLSFQKGFIMLKQKLFFFILGTPGILLDLLG